MKSMNISPEKQQQLEEVASSVGEAFGRLVGSLIATAIIAGVFYAILHFMVGLSITYVQVLGVILILDFLKNFLKK
jgi:TRAP-type mannitol/chloroaromatic compound transport system permease large subunit